MSKMETAMEKALHDLGEDFYDDDPAEWPDDPEEWQYDDEDEDYSPSCPWNAPGMSIRDFIRDFI